MGAELVEEADLAVLGPKGDVVLAEQAHRRRGVAHHQVLRQGEGDPVVLPHQPAHGRITLDPGHQLVLFPANHDRSSSRGRTPTRRVVTCA